MDQHSLFGTPGYHDRIDWMDGHILLGVRPHLDIVGLVSIGAVLGCQTNIDPCCRPTGTFGVENGEPS